MKKYIREMLNDLRRKRSDYIPPVIKLDAPPAPPLPGDLENQELSNDPLERVRQLDFQAQQSEERQAS
jgi:hypothetical protein